MINCLIIGLGKIGIEHLKACCSSKKINKIFILDKKSILDKLIDNKKIFKYELNKNQETSLLIVSTNASERFPTTLKILKDNFSIRWIVFEKFLSNQIREYTQIKFLLKKRNISAFVNCTRRSFPFYKKLKKTIFKKKFHMTVIGNNISMGSNSIHFIDLFQFFLEDTIKFSCDINIDEKFKSKRRGYYDFNGTLFVYSNNSSLSIIENKNLSPAKIYITSSLHNLYIDEIDRKYCLIEKNKSSINSFEFLNIKDTTNTIISQLIKSGKCDLPSFEISSIAHIEFLKSIRKKHNLIIS